MSHRPTNVAFALLVTMMLPIGTALAQGSTTAPAGAAGGTTGIGNASGVNSGAVGTTGALSPPLAGQSSPPAPVAVQGFAEQNQAISSTGLARTAADGVSTEIVPARRCSTAAHETDGTTTCVGIPARR
jgi:hypothetical protein